MDTKDAMLLMRIPSAVKDALRAAADADQRTMSSYVLKAVTDRLIASGYLPQQAASKKRTRRG